MTASPQELLLGARITGDFVMLAPEERRRHLYVVGQTGTGKSTLLLNLIAQDLASGAGLALARSARRSCRSRAAACAATPHERSRLPEPGRQRAADRLQSPLRCSRGPETDRRRWRRLRLPACLAGELGAAARLHPDQCGARVARRARRHAADAPPPADRRSVPGAARRGARRRSVCARLLARRVCRLRRSFPGRGDLPDPEQDRQGADRAAAAQHAGAAQEHDHACAG